MSDVEGSATTNADGSYVFQNVPVGKHAVKFSKKDFQTISATVLSSNFDENNKAIINMTMTEASGKVMGTIKDAKNNNAPFEGVTVTLGSLTTTSDKDGNYLFESLSVEDYTISFSIDGYTTITRNISENDFVDKIATLNILMGSDEILPGLTAEDLKKCR